MGNIKTKYLLKIAMVLIIVLCAGISVFAQKKKTPPPKPPENPFNIGADLYNKKDYRKAIEIFKKIAVEHPDSADAVYYLGSSNLKIGNYESGMELLRKAAVLVEKYKDSLNNIVYSEIPLPLYKLDYAGDELITKVSNGIRISGGMYQEMAPLKILNDLTYPIWGEAAQVVGYGAEIGGFYDPTSFNIGYLAGEINLKTVKQRFALPPGIPSPEDGGFDSKIKVSTISFSAHYTPAVLLWGYLYPAVGGCFMLSTYKHGSLTQSITALGVSVELLAKYKNLFIKGGYKKSIDNKSFDNQLSLQFGFKINMFN